MTGPSSCPSTLRLARWEAGRAGSSSEERRHVSEHVRDCARCRGLAAEIDAARRELLVGDPAAMHAAHRIATTVAQRRHQQQRLRWRVLAWVMAPTLAAAALALVVVPRMNATSGDATVATGALAPRVRAKGQLVLDAFCKRGESVFRVEDGAALLAGDRLRFAYTAPQPGHLMIFGVDDSGQLFPYYGEESLAGIAVSAGAGVMLPGSVELDNHHGVERVFALWSRTPIDAARVRRAVAQALAGSGDIARAARLDVPADQVSYLLTRP